MKRALPYIVVSACVVALVLGMLHLFQIRYERGDVYPPYSSLRSDPLGTMALFESLDRVGLQVQRDFTTQNQLPEKGTVTYLHLAAHPYELRMIDGDVADEIERFVRSGGRLAITFRPWTLSEIQRQWTDYERTNRAPAGPVEEPAPPDAADETPRSDSNKAPVAKASGNWNRSLAERWGLEVDFIRLPQYDATVFDLVEVTRAVDLPLPVELPWHSGWVLTNVAPGWNAVYRRGQSAVIAERTIGRGSVVIATDSYFVSNEAMYRDRHPELLAWLIGPHQTVMFDEGHLGVTEQPGMATLLRKYRLYWVATALIGLAGLFIWKNAMSLLPPQERDERRDFVAGKDAYAGFVNLLRRCVAPTDLLPTAVAEWRRTATSTRHLSESKLEAIDRIATEEHALPRSKRDPLRAYQRIRDALQVKARSNPDPATSGQTHPKT